MPVTGDDIQVAQNAPRPKQERPKRERPDGTDGREPAGKGTRPTRPERPRDRDGDREPVLPPWIGMGVQMGGLSVQEADQNSIELAASPHVIPKGSNQIT